MRALLACTVLVLAVGVICGGELRGEQCVCKYGGGGDGKPSAALRERMDVHAARLSRISAKVQELNSLIDRGKAKARDIILGHKSMRIRLRNLEGTPCHDQGFYCGDDDNVCVGTLLVCDGHKDCPGGLDEHEILCKAPIEAGTVLEGGVHAIDLCTVRKPDKFKLVITEVRSLTYFTHHLHVKANLILKSNWDNVEGHSTLPVEGYYCFARSRLVFHPPEDDRLGLICQFDPTDPSTCDASVIHEQSLEKCLEFTMNKV